MAYKYLNTCYKGLYDSGTSGSLVTTDGFIVNEAVSYVSQFTKEINSEIETTSIYIKYTVAVNTTDLKHVFNLQTINGDNLVMSASSTQIKFNDANNSFTWTGDVPSTAYRLKSGITNTNFYKRDILVHFDTVANHAEVYSDGILCGSFNCGNNGEYIRRLHLGSISAAGNNGYYTAFKDVIISDTEIPLTETITDVTPVITSTDWTINDGLAITNVVGGTMILTPPSNAIDETKKTITGYSAVFLDCAKSETINSVTVTQGTTNQQVSIPTSGGKETKDTFTVTQLSSISATVTASYTTP